MSKSPGHQEHPDHQVLEKHPKEKFQVKVNGTVLADSTDVIEVDEDDCPKRFYFPRSAVKMNLLNRSETTTECPFKGLAHYYSLKLDGKTFGDAVWTYEAPYEEHQDLKDRLAFYDDKIQEIKVEKLASMVQSNKEIVLKAVDTLFNQKDLASAERYWSPRYIQHSAYVPPGKDGLFEFVKNAPKTLRYENHLVIANGDYVMFHGRYSGLGIGVPNWIVVDIVRIENGVIVEHWDVIQDEATEKQSKSGLPMFGDRFPKAA